MLAKQCVSLPSTLTTLVCSDSALTKCPSISYCFYGELQITFRPSEGVINWGGVGLFSFFLFYNVYYYYFKFIISNCTMLKYIIKFKKKTFKDSVFYR